MPVKCMLIVIRLSKWSYKSGYSACNKRIIKQSKLRCSAVGMSVKISSVTGFQYILRMG